MIANPFEDMIFVDHDVLARRWKKVMRQVPREIQTQDGEFRVRSVLLYTPFPESVAASVVPLSPKLRNTAGD